MKDEKILANKTLNDEELEQFVGGYYDTWHDYESIKKIFLRRLVVGFSLPRENFLKKYVTF